MRLAPALELPRRIVALLGELLGHRQTILLVIGLTGRLLPKAPFEIESADGPDASFSC